jgi:hypothetical protein
MQKKYQVMMWIPTAMVKTIPDCTLLYTSLLGLSLVTPWMSGCSELTQAKVVEQTCNGLSELCDRPLDAVLFVGTHNAMSSSEDQWNVPNQKYAFERQLQDGVRALNFDTYWSNEEAYLCHVFCELGSMTLIEGLSRIARFLNQNPNEVVLITIQSALETERTLDAFEQAGLRDMMYQHEVGDAWPTLGTLIDKDERLVVFTSDGGGLDEGYMDQLVHWIDNPYSAQSIADFSCLEDRGDPSTASLFNVNHFITNPLANIENSLVANQYDVLWDHLERCQYETGRVPNQILVDFYSQGAVLDVVLDWNQFENMD